MKIIFLLYFLAQIIHTVSRAGLTAKRQYVAFNAVRDYFAIHWPQLLAQYFLSIALLLILWGNEAAMNLIGMPSIGGGSKHAQFGLAIVLGWFSDSFLDKVLGLFNLDRKPARLEDETKDAPAPVV